jgi:hypothetical protein
MAKLGDNLSVPQAGTPGRVANPQRNSGFSNGPPSAVKISGVNSTKIILEDSADIPPTGLFIGHNGNSYMVLTGIEVLCPQPLLDILDDAVTTVPIIDPHTQRIVGSRTKQRFPYRLVVDRRAA